VLATTGVNRSALMPDVPSLVELGVFDGTTDYWMGLMAPPGTPAPIIARVRQAAERMMAAPEMAQFAANGGGEAATGSPEAFARLLAQEQQRWADVIRRNQIRAE
jgi:tripartite-type tricarboxylate transporter receptor subunit TctC